MTKAQIKKYFVNYLAVSLSLLAFYVFASWYLTWDIDWEASSRTLGKMIILKFTLPVIMLISLPFLIQYLGGTCLLALDLVHMDVVEVTIQIHRDATWILPLQKHYQKQHMLYTRRHKRICSRLFPWYIWLFDELSVNNRYIMDEELFKLKICSTPTDRLKLYEKLYTVKVSKYAHVIISVE